MKKTFIKTVFKDLWHNISRFIAIIAIVTLGVGFLIGLLSATPDLQLSLDTFYDEQNAYDILIKSTIGFKEEDAIKLKDEFDFIEDIIAYEEKDEMTRFNSTELASRIITMPFDGGVNNLKLVSGRMPENSNECVVLAKDIFEDVECLNEIVTIDSHNYTIVGMCQSPVYYYKRIEPTSIGMGNIEAYIYLDSKYNEMNNITDLAFTLKDALGYNRFSSDYYDFINPYEDEIEVASSNYLEERYRDLFNDVYETIKLEYKKNIKDAMSGLVPEAMLDRLVEEELLKHESEIVELSKQELAKFTLKWYVLDCRSNVSYLAFKENSNKVNRIAVVFPFFFFFIAALIALTSITRMVSEDRSGIGTLKSLGYSNLTILGKYLFYALFSCLIGAGLGIISGVYILPIVIYNCYITLFVLPPGIFAWNPLIICLSSLSMILTIFIVMIFVCLKTLRERPNALLVPRAPKAGKRILLERISILWSHLKFKYKSALRNVFRFKRNLIMMVVGIGGCTGLLLVGLGLNDSMGSLSRLQYDEILKYDFLLESDSEIELDFLSDSKYFSFRRETGNVASDQEYNVSIFYTDDDILNYFDLNTSSFEDDAVIISFQLAKNFHLKPGDNIILDIDGEDKTFKVTGTFDNYIDNYVIVNRKLVSEVDNNAVMIKLGKEDKLNYDSIVKRLYNLEVSVQIEDKLQTRKNYDSMVGSIETIVFVVILCSGALAMIVIYNLTNININERIKEIATLKVLGYQKFEVLSYIFREIIFMSVLGILFGFVLGPILSYFVMDRISSAGHYFSPFIAWYNYIYAFLITLIFVLLVVLLFIRKIKGIKMVESLKCVD